MKKVAFIQKISLDYNSTLLYNYLPTDCRLSRKKECIVSNRKEAEERKKNILDIAEELFIAKGYDRTTTTDILERAGIARGTLYYHFKSKEEILDALIDRIMDGIVLNVKSAISDNTTAIQKIISFIGAVKVESAIGKEITDYAHRSQNALMHQKIQTCLLSVINPLAVEIINDGIRQGCFLTSYPEEAVEMLLIYSSVIFDNLNEMTDKEREKKAAGFVFNMERLLGTPSGCFSEITQYL